MSLKPGIGAGIIPDVASALMTHNLENTLTDVPTSLRSRSRVQPIGRYLTQLLRKNIGRAPNASEETIRLQQAKMLPLRQAARQLAPKGTYLETLKEVIRQANEGKYRQLVAKSKITKKRESL